MQVPRSKLVLTATGVSSVVLATFVWAGDILYENAGHDIERKEVQVNMSHLYERMGSIESQVGYIEEGVGDLEENVQKLEAGQAEILREIRARRNPN